MQKILIIDDEEGFARLLCSILNDEGFHALVACDGVEGLRTLQEKEPHLVLLDVMLPRMNGWELCRRIRDCSDVPIIMLTALSTTQDKVRGLELGADDYITKPFSNSELIARVHAALRRGGSPLVADYTVRIDDRLCLDRARCKVIVDGRHVALSPLEYKILDCFVDNANRILTHQSLLTQVWGWEYADEADYLKVYVCNLRKKIEPDPRKPRYIVTERGLGYSFQAPC
jgi:two-component system KDP operon response regulator KdpE